MAQQLEHSKGALLANINGAPHKDPRAVGSVRAATPFQGSKLYQNYNFHWVRDGALVMAAVVSLLERALERGDRREAKLLEGLMGPWEGFERRLRATATWSDDFSSQEMGPLGRRLGEPKFYLHGAAFEEGWGRPQDDGPALRALTLMSWARLLMGQGRKGYVKKALYGPMREDLDYVAQVARLNLPCRDLWEETFGWHLYTRVVQRKALKEGARLARSLGDEGAAVRYEEILPYLAQALGEHWLAKEGVLGETITDKGPLARLDVAVILGALHTQFPEELFLGPTDERVLATAERIIQAFARGGWEINRASEGKGLSLGPAVGRYVGDRYDGGTTSTSQSGGNPWVLATLAMAELHYRAAARWRREGRLTISPVSLPFFQSLVPHVEAGMITVKDKPDRFQSLLEALRRRGDSFLRRIQRHRPQAGPLAEQIHRSTGAMTGQGDLTWSHAAFISAVLAR